METLIGDPHLTLVAVLVACITSACSLWMARGRNRIENTKTIHDGLTSLVNELQQERDNVRKVYDTERKDFDRTIARCNRRITHLETRMSMLVVYVRKIETFLRGHKLQEKAPKFDWTGFYTKRDNGGSQQQA